MIFSHCYMQQSRYSCTITCNCTQILLVGICIYYIDEINVYFLHYLKISITSEIQKVNKTPLSVIKSFSCMYVFFPDCLGLAHQFTTLTKLSRLTHIHIYTIYIYIYVYRAIEDSTKQDQMTSLIKVKICMYKTQKVFFSKQILPDCGTSQVIYGMFFFST